MSNKKIRIFESGSSRNNDEGKLEYAGFLCPLVLESYAKYMHKHRHLETGELRPSNNWKRGIPTEAYMQSLMRHVMDIWLEYDGHESRDGKIEALNAVIFNAMGLLRNELIEK